MPSILALTQDRREIKVPLNGKPLEQCGPDEVVTLVYRPSAVDLDMEVKTRELRGVGQPIRLLAETLHNTLIGWDVTQPKLDALGQPIVDANGQVVEVPAPLSVELLGSLGIKRLAAWNEAVTADMWPDPPIAGASANGLSPTAPAAG